MSIRDEAENMEQKYVNVLSRRAPLPTPAPVVVLSTPYRFGRKSPIFEKMISMPNNSPISTKMPYLDWK